MNIFLQSTNRVMRREWTRISERRTLYLLSILLPLFLFPFLVSIYQQGLVRDLPAAMFDQDHGEVSRLLGRSFESTSTFRITRSVSSMGEIESLFRRGEIQAAFVIPPHFERNVKSGEPTAVTMYYNATNLIVANLSLKDGATVIKSISAGVLLKKLRSRGLSEQQAMGVVNAIRVDTRPLFNANYNYMNYLGLGLVPAMFQMLIMVAAVVLISSEFTHGTFRALAELAHGRVLAILIGKSVPHLMIHLATCLGVLVLLFPSFGIHGIGSFLSAFFLWSIFVAASFFFGLAISTLFHNQMFATELALFLNIPAFIFSGFIYPEWAMPALHRAFASILPFTHFLRGFLKVFQMGSPWKTALPEIGILCAFIVLSLSVIIIELRLHLHALYHNKPAAATETLS